MSRQLKASEAPLQSHGAFSGEPRTAWCTELDKPDRDMVLLADFSYVDPAGRTWLAQNTMVVDGASIPRALWSLVGSPYTGDYRRASVVHDIACDDAGDDYDARLAADRMFYHACRCGGCSVGQAIILYLGVRIGAFADQVTPWRTALRTPSPPPRLGRTASEQLMEAQFREIALSVLQQGETEDLRLLERRFQQTAETVLSMKFKRTARNARRPQARPKRAGKLAH